MVLVTASSRLKKSFALIVFFFITANVQAQGWQSAYNTTVEFYYNADYPSTIVEGEKALNLASNAMEKLYTLKVLSATCNDAGMHVQGIEFSKQEIRICVSESVPDSVYIGSLNNLANNYLGEQLFEKSIPQLNKIVTNINFLAIIIQ